MPPALLRRLLFLRITKGDAEQVAEVLSWGGDPNWRSPRAQRPAIVRAVRGRIVEWKVVEVLLRAGADPAARDATGLTALDHARRRLATYEGKPRKKPRRSPSLTPGGELRLPEWEWESIERMEAKFPGSMEDYLRDRRKVAERVFDTRGSLERIVEMLSGPGGG